jgi:hypothetical protein
MSKATVSILTAVIAALGVILGQSIPAIIPALSGQVIPTLSGSVLRDDFDPTKRSAIEKVSVTAQADDGTTSRPVLTDSNGLFTMPLSFSAKIGKSVTLNFSHPNFEELNKIVPVVEMADSYYLWPKNQAVADERPVVRDRPVRFLLAAYAPPARELTKTFQVANRANVRCNGQQPCSPDGKWKATIGSATLDAGAGDVFTSGTATCIAGPCAFARIETDGFSKAGARTISVAVRCWSDTVTFRLSGTAAR